jgi:2-phosphosulfolactate phosphatase
LIAGFDFNNSPAGMAAADVRGRLLIQRTGAGTQGAVNATGAAYLLPCSLVTARATAAYARRLAEATGESITLMPTESISENEAQPMEDHICTDYLEALLLQQADAPDVLAAGIQRLRDSGRLEVFARGHPDFPSEDVPAFLAADRFAFAMQGEREEWNGITLINTRRVDALDQATQV